MSNQDISGFGLSILLVAEKTFPSGINITQFADDADPLDIPSIKFAEPVVGLNGDLGYFGKAVPLEVGMSLFSGSDDDLSLKELVAQNRPFKGRAIGARESISLIISYPSGKTVTYSKGTITDGAPAPSVASSSRIKTSEYRFVFQDMSVQSGAANG